VKNLTYRLLFSGYFFTKFCGPENSPVSLDHPVDGLGIDFTAC